MGPFPGVADSSLLVQLEGRHLLRRGRKGQGAYLNFPRSFFGQKSFWIHNASLSWRSENDWIEITGWVHNFLDQQYKTASDDFSLGL